MTESSSQKGNVVVECLQSWSQQAVAEVIEFQGETTVVVPRNLFRAAAERCRSDNKLQFNLLTDATCVDRYPVEPRFELNYHLVSIPRRDRVRLQVRLSGQDPVVDSLVPVWPGANWLEREIFDLFGIRFNGHPDLRRILLPEDWEGYPLRRDFPVEGFRDVPNSGDVFNSGDLFKKSRML
ncbi:MAG TPA: NADH-quinone oxidoreductase subunit C [Candidatus Acidoferrum sp.]|nr:NADH-quinone oxidoreductase subunit C [Candidatus Acidoferrum sp.]